MQLHYAEVFPESFATLPRWVEAGFIAINRVSVYYCTMTVMRMIDINYCMQGLYVCMLDIVVVVCYNFESPNFIDWPTGPQLPNCQTQCHFSWLVVSPLRQKSTWSGNLVLAGILAFSAVKTASLSPPLSPLATSISALRTGAAPQASSWWTWAPAAHSLPVPSSDSTQPNVF